MSKTTAKKAKKKSSKGTNRGRSQLAKTRLTDPCLARVYIEHDFNGRATAKALDMPVETLYSAIRRPVFKRALQEEMVAAGIIPERVTCGLATFAFHVDIADFEGLFDGSETLESLRKAGIDTRAIKKFQVREATNKGGDVTSKTVILELYPREKAYDQLIQVLRMAQDDGNDDGGEIDRPDQIDFYDVVLEDMEDADRDKLLPVAGG